MTINHRRATLPTLAGTAMAIRDRAVDYVVPQERLTVSDNGTILSFDDEATITPDGVAPGATRRFDITHQAHRHIAGRLNIPVRFSDHLREQHGDVWDDMTTTLFRRDSRSATVRVLNPAPSGDFSAPPQAGRVRAILSDRYQIVDNSDVLAATLGALQGLGLDGNHVEVEGDIDEGKMRIRIHVPQIAVNAADLLGNYRSPFSGKSGRDLPMVFAGIEVSNSEVGGGAFSIRPRMVMEVCSNGMTRDQLAHRTVHMGSVKDEGIIDWSAETNRLTLELITSKAQDAIGQFLTTDFVSGQLDDMRKARGLEVQRPGKAIERLGKNHQFSDEQADAILNAFMRSGDTSTLGLAHAVTAAAQAEDDSDEQARMESAFWAIVSDAAKYATAS